MVIMVVVETVCYRVILSFVSDNVANFHTEVSQNMLDGFDRVFYSQDSLIRFSFQAFLLGSFGVHFTQSSRLSSLILPGNTTQALCR